MTDRETRRSAFIQTERATALTMLVAGLWLVMSPLRSARLGEIDDHQYLAMVGHGSRLALSRVPGLIWHALTTFGGRFHPFYDALLVVEVAIAGVNPHAWYALRATLALSCLVATYLLARQVLRPLWSAVVALILLGGPQSQTWVRLGPLEGEATAFLLFGMLVLVRWHRNREGRLLIAGLGLIWLSALIKESFSLYPLIFLLAAVAVTAFERRPIRVSRVALGVLVLLAVLPILGVIVSYAEYGDPYARDRTISGAVHAGWSLLVTPDPSNGRLLMVCVALTLVLVRRVRSHTLSGVQAYSLVMIGAFLLWVVPQAAIYASGGLDGAFYIPRYYLPGCLFHVTAVGAAIWLIDSQVQASIVERASSIALAGLAILVTVPQLLYWRDAARLYTNESITFQRRLDTLSSVMEENSLLPLRFETSDPSADYEPIISVKQYLDWREARTIPAMLAFTTGPLSDPFEVRLHAELSAISHNGELGFFQHDEVPTDRSCIGVEFHVASPTQCRFSVSFL